MIFWLLLIILALFVGVAAIGAPYVPTHKKAIKNALDMLQLKKGSTVIDLGSGDGVFLKAAALRGYKAIGYEINPVLWLVSWLRCLPVRTLASVKLINFWLVPLPKTADAIYVFAASPFMKRLAAYIKKGLAGHHKPLVVISYGFELPGFKAIKSEQALHYYRIVPR